MVVIGITGLIGTGKSTVAGLLRRFGCAVHDADSCVHDLYKKRFVQETLLQQFPFARNFWTRQLSRNKLMNGLCDHSGRKEKLESIVHPLVRQSQLNFLHKNKHKRFVVLDVPLLFETQADVLCDVVWVTHCLPEIQRKRVLRRAGFTPEKLEMILRWQGDGVAKRQAADWVIDTGVSKARLALELKNKLDEL